MVGCRLDLPAEHLQCTRPAPCGLRQPHLSFTDAREAAPNAAVSGCAPSASSCCIQRFTLLRTEPLCMLAVLDCSCISPTGSCVTICFPA